MVEGRLEAAGELVAGLLAWVPAAVWAPQEVLKAVRTGTLNPFRDPPEMSEAMRKHLEGWRRDQMRAQTGG